MGIEYKKRQNITNLFFLGIGAFALVYIVFELVSQDIWAQLGWMSWSDFFGVIIGFLDF